MVSETQVNGRTTDDEPQRSGSGRAVRQGLSGMMQDIAELSSLQAKLTALDLREAGGRSVFPVVCIVAAVLIALACLPVLLLGVGAVLIEQFEWSESIAYLVTGGVSLVLAAMIGWFGWAKLQAAMAVLERSKRELIENVNSIRETITRSDSR